MSETVAIKERGILFKAEMVRAILDNRKRQTRRTIPDLVVNSNQRWKCNRA